MGIRERLARRRKRRAEPRFGESRIKAFLRMMRIVLWVYIAVVILAAAGFFLCMEFLPSGHFWTAGWILGVTFAMCGVAIIGGFSMALKLSRDMEMASADMTLSAGVTEVAAKGQCGIIALDQEDRIVWISSYLIDNEFSGVGESIETISPELKETADKGQTHPLEFERENRRYLAEYSAEDSCFFIYDITRMHNLKEAIRAESPFVGTVQVDDFAALGKGGESSEEVNAADLMRRIRSCLEDYANRYRIYICQNSEDSFLMLGQANCLRGMRDDGFSLCSELKQALDGKATISAGVAWGYETPSLLSKRANEMLELCKSRGGDQFAISSPEGNRIVGDDNTVRFSARGVLAEWCHSLLAEVRSSSNVIIVPPHRSGFDELGATMALFELCHSTGIPSYWVYDLDKLDSDVRSSTSKACMKAKADNEAKEPQDAKRLINSDTLFICLGFSHPEGSAAPLLFNSEYGFKSILIRGRNPIPTTLERPIMTLDLGEASSYSELVAGMIETGASNLAIRPFTATLLYAGIIESTSSFTVNTRSNTFLAAAFLERQKANSTLAQDLLRESGDDFKVRMQILSTAQTPFPKIMVCYDPGWISGALLSRDAAERAAETAMSISEIKDAFALTKSGEQKISIAARSDGSMDVLSILKSLTDSVDGNERSCQASVSESDLEAVREDLISAIAKALGVKDPYEKKRIEAEAKRKTEDSEASEVSEDSESSKDSENSETSEAEDSESENFETNPELENQDGEVEDSDGEEGQA